jgi:hypothetical protein
LVTTAATVNVADFVVSWLPALSIEYHEIVWDALPELGAATETEVPAVHAPLSSLYDVLATPDPAVSTAERLNVCAPM